MNKTKEMYIHPYSRNVLDSMIKRFKSDTGSHFYTMNPKEYLVLYFFIGKGQKMINVYNLFYEKIIASLN